MTETRYQRVAREQRERQAAREARLAAERKGQRRKRTRNQPTTAWSRSADRIDGYDRDDLGESPDY